MSLYITREGRQFGPYSLDDARNLLLGGTLAETDWAWHEGLPEWVPLKDIPGIKSATPPPAHGGAPAPSPISTAPVTVDSTPSKGGFFGSIGKWIAGIAILLFKFKFILFGALKTSLSMLLMIWLYSTIFGWPFAVGIVVLLFVHEMGHVIAAKRLGMPVTAPLFIPFVGAFITMKENPRDAWTEALMAYGGPFAGCIGSWICLVVGVFLDQNWLIGVASASFVLNLFNMIPVPPLDGGRICAAISPWFWLIGLVLLGMALVYFHSFQTVLVLGIIVIFATLPRLKETFFGHPTPEMQAYYNTHISNRISMAVMYLGLFAALMAGYWDASSHLAYLWDQNQ